MADEIFLIDKDGGLTAMSDQPYESESLLQRLIAQHPDVLVGGQVDPSRPRRWALVKRELGVPAAEEGNARWSLDHLFLDQDGVPTLVEVKRSSDTRLRREVVGQMLDYAANAVAYWPVDLLREAFAATHLGTDRDTDEVFLDLFGPGVEPETFWANVEDNLRAGNIRLVFLADVIPDELRRIVEFLNEQMARAEVIALEVKQYVADGLRTLVPRVIGRTTAAERTKRATAKPTYEEYLETASPAVKETKRRLETMDVVDSTRRTRAGMSFYTEDGIQILHFYPGFGTVDISVGSIREAGLDEWQEIWRSFSELAGRELSEQYLGVPCEQLIEKWERFELDLIPRYLEIKREAYRRLGKLESGS